MCFGYLHSYMCMHGLILWYQTCGELDILQDLNYQQQVEWLTCLNYSVQFFEVNFMRIWIFPVSFSCTGLCPKLNLLNKWLHQTTMYYLLFEQKCNFFFVNVVLGILVPGLHFCEGVCAFPNIVCYQSKAFCFCS